MIANTGLGGFPPLDEDGYERGITPVGRLLLEQCVQFFGGVDYFGELGLIVVGVSSDMACFLSRLRG